LAVIASAANAASFSASELSAIQQIWARVAEDFAPFNIDVTTINPGSLANKVVAQIAIGGNGSWYGSAGGVAYVGGFYNGASNVGFVFEDNLANGDPKFVAEAASHEAGHTLGLSHDGATGTSYYRGSGSGETGWAPIMGNGYYQNLTQFSKGEYAGANNTQDDLSIITTKNGFSYRADDYGNSSSGNSSVTLSGTNRSVAISAFSATRSTQRTSAISPSVNVNGPSCTVRYPRPRRATASST
jgi:hypothetical protein